MPRTLSSSEAGSMRRYKLAVFGTLKAGFALHERGLAGIPKLFDCRTLERFPLVIAGPWFTPMILNQPGSGLRIEGEVYEVDRDRLALIDRLESVPKPGNLRVPIEVESCDGNIVCTAFAYMKTPDLAQQRHSDFLARYEDRRFIPVERRPGRS